MPTATLTKPQTDHDEPIVRNIISMATLLGDDDGSSTKASFIAPKIGALVTGTVVSIARHKILVDIGSVCTGIISGVEIADSSGTAKGVQVGDTIQAVVIGEENDQGQFILSLKRASQETTWESFIVLYKNQKTTHVKIVEANKGGLLIEQDGIRGFIPVSQLTPEHYPRVSGADPEKILARLQKLIGQSLEVKVINVDFPERRLILSEKAAFSDARQKVIDELKVGQAIDGTVSGVVNFGIFVNYKGVEGLVHISEIAWGHVTAPNEYAKVGDIIKVLIIGIEGDKVSFSMKRLTPDPWVEKADKYAVGQTVKGVVTRIEPFGAFVKLDNEIDGLIHISELAQEEVKDPSQVVKVSDTVEAKVISIELNEHRLGLSIKALTSPVTEEKTVEEKPAKKKKKIEDDIAAEAAETII